MTEPDRPAVDRAPAFGLVDRDNLDSLIIQVNESSEPLTATERPNRAVLLGDDDWRSLQESLFLLSIPSLAESIRTARKEGIDVGAEQLGW